MHPRTLIHRHLASQLSSVSTYRIIPRASPAKPPQNQAQKSSYKTKIPRFSPHQKKVTRKICSKLHDIAHESQRHREYPAFLRSLQCSLGAGGGAHIIFLAVAARCARRERERARNLYSISVDRFVLLAAPAYIRRGATLGRGDATCPGSSES